jgi:2-aminoadipate transaminase
MSTAVQVVAEPPVAALPLARRMSKVKTSAVREILKVAERPDVLSFAGGLPAPELFPLESIAEAYAEVLGSSEGRAALQYSTTEGYGPLREWICKHLGSYGVRAETGQVLITSGSQQGIDLAGKVLLDRGDVVAVENPSYLAALQAFGAYEASFAVVGSDDHGMRVEELERLVARRRPKLIYVVADFHNPKGTSLSLERRMALVKLAQRHRIPILEDNPYGELRFRGGLLPPLAALDEEGVVIHLSTFSKTLAPGLRIGWATGPQELIRAMTVCKQAADLHTATLAQRAAAKLLTRFDYEGHLQRLRAVYGERCQAMLAALERHMPEGTRWTQPDGGMFVWVELPHGLSGDTLLPKALQQRVAFVPGSAFFAEDPQPQFIRLNYSNRPPEAIDEGLRRLGTVLREEVEGVTA